MAGGSTFKNRVFYLCDVCLATIGLFYALSYWNNWYKCLLYIDTSHSKLYTLQYLIQRILRQVNYASNLPGEAASLQGQLPTLIIAIFSPIFVEIFSQIS